MRSSGARLLRLAARSLQGEAGVSTSAAGSLLRPVISPCCARGPAASAAPRSAVPPPFHPAGAAAWREHALPAAAHALGRAQWRAGFADQAGKGAAGGGDDGSSSEATGGSSAGADSDDGSDGPTVEQLTAELQERERVVEELQGKVTELADSFKRSLAEMENLRQRTTRQVENAHKFAVEPIIKSLLDVADNLQRAAEAVPPAAVDGSEALDAERAARLLRSLLEGVQMTESMLINVFKKHGVEPFDPAGDKFDPNLHQAMFEVPDGSKEAGVVAVVTKRGYRMHDRVLRAAEVGVFKAP